MGQANSVQREPSMEEILASIRRIIEDSDGSRKGPGEPAPAPSPAARAAEPAEIAAFRTGLQEQGRPEAPAGEESGQFGAASGYHAAAEGFGSSPSTVRPASDPGFQFSSPAALRLQPADEIEMELEIDGFGEAPPAEHEMRADDGHDTPDENDTPADARPPILSENTGRQVAASFGELSDALAARSRKSYDQIAEEMLRPMLQDWLDNNLPHLVEKLVREEIERIARGPAPR